MFTFWPLLNPQLPPTKQYGGPLKSREPRDQAPVYGTFQHLDFLFNHNFFALLDEHLYA